MAISTSGRMHRLYLAGKLTDYEYPEEKIKEALSKLPVI